MIDFTLVQKVKVVSKFNGSDEIGEIISSAGYKKPIVVFDAAMRVTGIINRIEASLKAASLDFVEYDKVVPNPTDDIVNDGYDVCKENSCDCVLAIGGGSAIDTGKGIQILRFNPGKILSINITHINSCPGYFSIPTTAGTGSELSQGAIISDQKTDRKLLIPTDCFTDEYTILDASLTLKLPKKQTIFTGLDVFSHAAEAYTATRASVITDMLCEKIMDTVVNELPAAVSKPDYKEARERMLNAASLGGWVLYCSSDHLGHAIAHIIGARYNIVHGLACRTGFPAMIRFIAPSVPEKIAVIGGILGADVHSNDAPEEIADKTINVYERFCADILQTPKATVQATSQEIESMAHELAKNPFLEMCPRHVAYDDATRIIEDTLE